MTEPDFDLLRQELAKLSERSERMTEEMGTLAGALVNVAQLQENQREIEQAARQASTRVEEVAATSATKDDIYEVNQQRRRAVRNLYIAIASGTLAVLAVGVGGVAAATAYSDSQHRFLQTQYDNCTIRNQSTQASRELVADLIEAEQHSVDPKTAAKLITTLQQAQSKQALVDCSKLLKG